MAWTYATLSTAIQDFCENTETSFVANIPVFIQSAEERIVVSAELDICRKIYTGQLTLGNNYLDLPVDYLSAISLAIISEGFENFLIQKDVELVQDYNMPPTTGTPKLYAPFSGTQILVSVTPDKDYDVELCYFIRPESIVTADQTWLGTNAYQALLYGSLVEAYTYMKGEKDILDLYTQRFSEALLRLKNFAEGRENTELYRDGTLRIKAT